MDALNAAQASMKMTQADNAGVRIGKYTVADAANDWLASWRGSDRGKQTATANVQLHIVFVCRVIASIFRVYPSGVFACVLMLHQSLLESGNIDGEPDGSRLRSFETRLLTHLRARTLIVSIPLRPMT